MIYILSGVAKSGKSTLASWFLAKRHISVFSTDFLMMALTKGNPHGPVNEKDDDKVVAKGMEPYLEAMIETMIHHRLDYLMEGVHFNPDFGAHLRDRFSHDLRIVYLGYAQSSEEDKFAEWDHYRHEVPTTWFAHHSDNQLRELVRYMLSESKNLKEKAIHYGLPYVDIHNLSEQKEEIEGLLFSSLELKSTITD